MIGPAEQARIDHEHGAPEPVDLVLRHQDWSDADWRAYRLELRRLGNALGPAPLRTVLAETVAMAATAEVARALTRRWGFSEWHALPLMWGLAQAAQLGVEAGIDARRESARRRGVDRAGDVPGGLRPTWPLMAVGLGSLAVRARLHWPQEDAAAVMVSRSIREMDERWRWRHHPVLGD